MKKKKVKESTASLYVKYRPTTFEEVVGQKGAVDTLSSMPRKKFPHALLFTGPSGCGKTTLARIAAFHKLRCTPHACEEINAATQNGIEMVRNLLRRYKLSPFSGPCSVFILDEAHQLSNDAQTALLKPLEDTPGHVYFMLATTHPQKLIPTIKTRCTEVGVEAVDSLDLVKLVEATCDKEGVNLKAKVVAEIANASNGSARKALVILQQVIGIESVEDQLVVIGTADAEKTAKDLCQVLLGRPKQKVDWKAVSAILKAIPPDKETPENLRRAVLGYASAVCLNGGPMAMRAEWILVAFREHFYDCGKAGLVLACREVCNQK